MYINEYKNIINIYKNIFKNSQQFIIYWNTFEY